MKQKKGIVLGLLLLLPSLIFSQENKPTNKESYILERYNIVVDGVTKDWALRNEMDLKEGSEFTSLEDLKKAVNRQQQDLINLRVFNKIELKLGSERVKEGIHYYVVDLNAEDTWTIIPFPYPKYDSNIGFRIGMKFFWDNALGSLNNVYIGMNMDISSEGIGNWTFNPQLKEVKIGKQEWNFSFMQQRADKKEKIAGTTGDGDENYTKKYSYYNTAFSVGTTFDFPHNISYSIHPSIGLNYGYKGKGFEGEEEPVYGSFSHSVSWGQVDWIGNFREGYSLGASNGYSYIYNPDAKDLFKANVGLGGSYYKIINSRLNYSGRFTTLYQFNDDMSSLGSYIRGVEDSTMSGNTGFFISQDLNISVIQWKGVGEAQFQPFIDFGLTKTADEAFDPINDMRYGTGADFILYLDKLKGLHARATIAVDLDKDLSWKSWDKYELIITSSLSY